MLYCAQSGHPRQDGDAPNNKLHQGDEQMPKTYCLECDAVIEVNKPREGAMIRCPQCGLEMEIVDIDPLDVDYPLDDDWYDDENDEWEEEE
jgi:alpha-aminoadipate carrier protein LysW